MRQIKNLVAVSNNQPITTSLKVAEVFNKPHKDVLEKIQKLQSDVATLNERKIPPVEFKATTYTDTKGERRPMYELTRDGFTLLAMGFTGKRALQFKLAYINAFNKMEEKLARIKELNLREEYSQPQFPFFNPASTPALWHVHSMLNMDTKQFSITGTITDELFNQIKNYGDMRESNGIAVGIKLGKGK